MDKVIDFFKTVITDLTVYFEKVYNQSFTNQTVDSCISIYNLCKEYNPDRVIEIGTNHGASTLALALAMNDLGKDLSNITTVDLDHEKWKESFLIHKDLINKHKLEVERIKTVTQDFNTINPEEIIDSSKSTFIFYDMHDHKGPWSQRLLDLWVPLVEKGVFAVHDITPVNEDFELEIDEASPRTKVQYVSGQYFAGFNECFRIIKWANRNKIKIEIFPGGVYWLK